MDLGVPFSMIQRGMLPPGSLLVTIIHSTGYGFVSSSSTLPSGFSSRFSGVGDSVLIRDRLFLSFWLSCSPCWARLVSLQVTLLADFPDPWTLSSRAGRTSLMNSTDSYCPRRYPSYEARSGWTHGLETNTQFRHCRCPFFFPSSSSLSSPISSPQLAQSCTKSRGVVGLGKCAQISNTLTPPSTSFPSPPLPSPSSSPKTLTSSTFFAAPSPLITRSGACPFSNLALFILNVHSISSANFSFHREYGIPSCTLRRANHAALPSAACILYIGMP